MSIASKRILCRTVFPMAAVVAAVVAAGSSFAQGLGGGGFGDPVRKIDVKFPGGTLADYIKSVQTTLKETSGNAGGLNVFFSNPETAAHPIPAVDFEQITVENAIMVLPHVQSTGSMAINKVGSIFQISVRKSRTRTASNHLNAFLGGGVADLGDGLGAGEGAGLDVRSQLTKPVAKTMVRVESVRSILERNSKEDLLSAIEIGIKLIEPNNKDNKSNTGQAVTLKLHEETGLLFIKGTRRQLDLIDNVLGKLRIIPVVNSVQPEKRSFLESTAGEGSR